VGRRLKSKAGEMLSVLMVCLLGKSGPCGRLVGLTRLRRSVFDQGLGATTDRTCLLVAQTFDRTHVRA
jgi:hypothetical protein